MRRFFESFWWRWRAWRIRRAYRAQGLCIQDGGPEPGIESYEGTALWRRPYDLHIDTAAFRNLLPLLRERRGQPGLAVEDLVQEAIKTAIGGEAKRRGLVFAGRFEQGDEVIVQWRDPAGAARLLVDEAAYQPLGPYERREHVG